jgi:lysophospholipase L1-like esterase
MFVFIGDSITEWPGGYVDMLAGRLGSVVNLGVAGDRLEHLQARWHVAAASVLTMYVGVNDTLVAFFEGPPTTLDVFEERYSDLLTRAAGIPRVIVVEPFFLAVDGTDAPWRDALAFARKDLDAKRPIVRRLASDFGATFVPLQDRFDAAADEFGAAAVAPDGVHPSPLGHRLIADAWQAAFATTSGK